jgi:predicted dehydrogenase
MPFDEPVKLAVLGLGFMGSTHLKALRGIAGARVVAAFDQDETRLSGDLTGVGGNIGTPGEKMNFASVRQYRDIGALLSDPEIDAVDICLPTSYHTPVAIEAVRAGKHVLVEKPMALDGRSADLMVEAAERHNRILMSAQVLRFWPEYVALRALVRESRLGIARCAAFRRRCAAPTWGGWLLDPAKSGGGAFDLLIHDVDICLHLFGKPEAVTALGYVDRGAGIDWLDAQLHYADGAAVSICGGWHNGGKFPFSMEYTVIFDRGTVDFRSGRKPPAVYSNDGSEYPLPLRATDGYAAELEYFIACCRDGRDPGLCPPRESADAVKVMSLILEARERKGGRLPCRI